MSAKISKKCFVPNCNNFSILHNVTLFRFPSEEIMRSAWINFVGLVHFEANFPTWCKSAVVILLMNAL